jgi:transcriptional regulator with XRE-family HTH domain
LLKVENIVATLKEYLETHKLTLTEFAARIEAPISSVHRYVTGEYMPKRDVMLRIFDATGGEVTANDFYGIEEPAPVSGGAADVVGLAAARLAEAQEDPGSPHPPAGQHLRVVTSEGES